MNLENSLKLVGTSHIAKQSVDEIKKQIKEWKPDIVAVELDTQRAYALIHEQKSKVSVFDMQQLGLKGYLFAKIGQYVQQKLGSKVGVAPGEDMKTALILANKESLQVALIDQPIQITLKNFSKSFKWKERWNFFVDILKGLFFPKRQIKEMGLEGFDLTKVPPGELIEKMVGKVKERYPSVYKVLIEDRNKYMVRRIVNLMRKYPDKKILVVVGAGHKKGMEKLLLNVDIVK